MLCISQLQFQRDPQSQRLYLHDVVTEKELVDFNSRSLNPTGLTVEGDNLYVTDILLNALNVKSEDLAQDAGRILNCCFPYHCNTFINFCLSLTSLSLTIEPLQYSKNIAKSEYSQKDFR